MEYAATLSQEMVAALAAQPVTHDSFIFRVHHAARCLFASVSLGFMRERQPHCAEGLGAIAADGRLLQVPPRDLMHASSPGIGLPVTTEHFAWQAFPAGGAIAAAVGLPAGVNGWFLRIALPLGPQDSRIIVLGSDTLPTPAPDHSARVFALATVATSLLRRLERVALIDAQAWIDSELKKLVELQELLRPGDLGNYPALDIAVLSKAHSYAGGDYYDVAHFLAGENAETDPERYTLALADVSGHGPAAAAEAAMMDTILRTFGGSEARHQQRGPAAVMTYMNRFMFSRRPRPSFATAFLAEWLPATRTLNFASAGHLPPLLKRQRQHDCIELDVGDDIPVNILRDYKWSERRALLEQNDILVLYTDGITEALAPDGSQFGQRRLREIVAAAPATPAAVQAAICAALTRHTHGLPNADDQTLFVVQFR